MADLRLGDSYDLYQAMDNNARFEANAIGHTGENANSAGWIAQFARVRRAIASQAVHPDPNNGLPLHEDYYPNYDYTPMTSDFQAAWLTGPDASGRRIRVVVTFGLLHHALILTYVDEWTIPLPSVSPSVATSGNTNGGNSVTLDAQSTCSQYLTADDASKRKLVNTIQDHLTATFGSNTGTTYVEVLNQDCPSQPTQTIENLLYGLGYYGR